MARAPQKSKLSAKFNIRLVMALPSTRIISLRNYTGDPATGFVAVDSALAGTGKISVALLKQWLASNAKLTVSVNGEVTEYLPTGNDVSVDIDTTSIENRIGAIEDVLPEDASETNKLVASDTVYTKDETYSAEEIDQKFANFGGFEVVELGTDGKPAVEDPSVHIIYLTKEQGSTASDPYVEWIWVSDAWECIGETSIDLTPYYTAEQVDTLVEDTNANLLADEFTVSLGYQAGSYVMYDGRLYQFDTYHSAGSWTGADAHQVKVGEQLAAQDQCILYTIPVDESPDWNAIYDDISIRNRIVVIRRIVGDGLSEYYISDTIQDEANAMRFVKTDGSNYIVASKYGETGIWNWAIEYPGDPNLAPTFDATTNYSRNDYVIYENDLYQFIVDHPADEWNELDVERRSVGNELNTKTNEALVADEFDETVAYPVGKYVLYDHKLYKFNTYHSAGAWNASHVTEINICSQLVENSTYIYKINSEGNQWPDGKTVYEAANSHNILLFDTVVIGRSDTTKIFYWAERTNSANSASMTFYELTASGVDGDTISLSASGASASSFTYSWSKTAGLGTINNIAPAFDSTASYTAGQCVIYNKELYQFTAAKSAGAWDSTKVQKTTISEAISSLENTVKFTASYVSSQGGYRLVYPDGDEVIEASKNKLVILQVNPPTAGRSWYICRSSTWSSPTTWKIYFSSLNSPYSYLYAEKTRSSTSAPWGSWVWTQVSTSDTKFAPEFDSSASYSVNDLVMRGNTLYRFVKDHSGNWSSSDVQQTDVATELVNSSQIAIFDARTDTSSTPLYPSAAELDAARLAGKMIVIITGSSSGDATSNTVWRHTYYGYGRGYANYYFETSNGNGITEYLRVTIGGGQEQWERDISVNSDYSDYSDKPLKTSVITATLGNAVFNDSVSYDTGDCVTYNGYLYKYTTPHAAGTWDSSEVQSTSIFNLIGKNAFTPIVSSNTSDSVTGTTQDVYLVPGTYRTITLDATATELVMHVTLPDDRLLMTGFEFETPVSTALTDFKVVGTVSGTDYYLPIVGAPGSFSDEKLYQGTVVGRTVTMAEYDLPEPVPPPI